MILPFEDAVGSATVVISLEWDLRRKLEVVIDLDGQEPCLGEGIASQNSDRPHSSAIGSERRNEAVHRVTLYSHSYHLYS